MNARRNRQLTQAAQPLLIPGERVELVSLVTVGTVSVRKQVLTTTVVAILTLGMVMATVRPKAMYLMLTDQRVLFFDGNRGGKPGKLLINFPRHVVTATETKKGMLGLTAITYLNVTGQAEGLKVTFPAQTRADSRPFAAAFPVTR
ncbi:PH domain-containing protein [Streptomyces beihaiensis]|uniref:PH domain-containing protein n=1 Tax=Streptomyces beihaiensis TaxID=2984495 RepID=A0ABT3TVI9_9ACTN|nr:hypothetical protein [Streptomyces beihaiensis]MCX3061034.1 hypothetical protein [Streptomyces beihaiensis]